MEPILYTALGAFGAGALLFIYLVSKKGAAWGVAKIKAWFAAGKADLEGAKADIAALKTDMTAVKAKVGL